MVISRVDCGVTTFVFVANITQPARCGVTFKKTAGQRVWLVVKTSPVISSWLKLEK